MKKNNLMWTISAKVLLRHNMLANMITASILSIIFGALWLYAVFAKQAVMSLGLWQHKIALIVTVAALHFVFVNWYSVKRILERDHPEFTIDITPTQEFLDEINRRNHKTLQDG